MLTSMLVVALCALPGPVAEPFSVAAARQHFVELDGVLYARQGGWSVSVDPRGVVAFTGTQRVAFEVVEVRRDGAACATGAQWRTADGVVAKVARACGVSETWATRDDGVEHSLVLDRAPPGGGPLRVKVATHGAWHHADAEGHVFAGPGGDGALRYGNAFVVRGGAKLPIEVEHVGGALELVVPAALVDAPDAFPLHLDPLVSREQWLDPNAVRPTVLDFSSESQPALAWSPSRSVAMVVWVDDRRLVQTDLFGALIRSDGTVVKPSLALVVEAGNELKPAVAWNPLGDRFVLAWEARTPADVALGVAWQEFDPSGLAVDSKHTIPGASSPSLALQPDAAVGFAYATTSSLVVRTLGDADAGPIPWSGPAVVKTSLAVSDAAAALAVEGFNPAAAQSHVWVYVSGVLQFNTVMSMGNESDPVVMFSGESPWVAYTAEGRVMARAVDGSSSVGRMAPSALPRFFLGDAGLTLGYRSGADIELLVVEPAMVGLATPVLRAVTDWAVVDADGTPLAVWTTGVLRTEVSAGPLPQRGQATSLGQVTWQHHPRVALRGGAGYAVWQGDSRAVFAAPVAIASDGIPTAAASMAVLSAATASRIEHVDVAMGDRHALVAVGQMGGSNAVRTRLLRGAMVTTHPDSPVTLSAASRLIGPAVAWSGTDYVVAWSDGENLFTQRLTPEGIKTPPIPVRAPGVTKLDLECLATRQCFVGWASADGGASVAEVDAGVVANALVSGVALSNDGVHLCGAWPDDGGLGYACVDAQHQALDPSFIPWAGKLVGDLSLSAGRPGVLVWSDGTQLWTARPGEQPSVVGEGFAPSVATELDGNGARGVVVATRFDRDFSLRAFVRGVSWPDDGGVDAGRDGGWDGGLDAGEDAGTDAGTADAGVTSVDFTTSGCAGCSAGAPAVMWLALVLPWLARRRLPLPLGRGSG